MNLTARTYHKVLKVARTIADLDGEESDWVQPSERGAWIPYAGLKNTGGGNVGDYEYWFARMKNISDNKKKKLREAYGSAKEIYYIEETQLRLQNFLTKKDIEQLKMARKQKDLEEKYYNMEEKGIDFVPYFQKTYPKRLSELDAAPYALYVKGKLPEEDRPSVAIIGARRCSNYGEGQALEYGKCLASAGVQIISGLALGIDGAGQRGALNGGGTTYGVLGCGVDICYPRENIGLYMDIQREGGIISEQIPGEPPMSYHFPLRNRIISGLADVVLVMEAKEKKRIFDYHRYGTGTGEGRICSSKGLSQVLSVRGATG